MPEPDKPASPKGPRQKAVALAYQDGQGAPRVVAKGNGELAAQIISRARDAGVFVHESKDLVALLMDVDLDRQIPPALYRAIAELLAWLYYVEAAQVRGDPALSKPAPPDVERLIDTSIKPAVNDANTE
jgi:flagellar biosynthesis protein